MRKATNENLTKLGVDLFIAIMGLLPDMLQRGQLFLIFHHLLVRERLSLGQLVLE